MSAQEKANALIASPAAVELIDAVGKLVCMYERMEHHRSMRPADGSDYHALASYVRDVSKVWHKHPLESA